MAPNTPPLLGCFLALVLLASGHPPCAHAQSNLVGKVVRIQDGDTLTLLDLDLRQHRVRISGIDAPEKGQPFGHVSQTHLGTLAFDKLANAHCPKVDQYGREVCTVFVEGTDIGLAQIKAGLAWHFKRFAGEQAADERDTYAKAEDEARIAQMGLWQESHPVAPWDWRHRIRVPAPGPPHADVERAQ